MFTHNLGRGPRRQVIQEGDPLHYVRSGLFGVVLGPALVEVLGPGVEGHREPEVLATVREVHGEAHRSVERHASRAPKPPRAFDDGVVLEVTEADAVVKGQTASSSYKPAMLENGVKVMVPPHIEAGTKIVVNTAEGTYMERAK